MKVKRRHGSAAKNPSAFLGRADSYPYFAESSGILAQSNCRKCTGNTTPIKAACVKVRSNYAASAAI
eukprot:1776915-Pleurochrysis_carterae.AAC.2